MSDTHAPEDEENRDNRSDSQRIGDAFRRHGSPYQIDVRPVENTKVLEDPSFTQTLEGENVHVISRSDIQEILEDIPEGERLSELNLQRDLSPHQEQEIHQFNEDFMRLLADKNPQLHAGLVHAI